jgi:hypothetical protein
MSPQLPKYIPSHPIFGDSAVDVPFSHVHGDAYIMVKHCKTQLITKINDNF